MMKKFTIYVQRQGSFVFKNLAILFRASAQSPNNIFSFRATGICRTFRGSYAVLVDFGSRLLSMVPLSK